MIHIQLPIFLLGPPKRERTTRCMDPDTSFPLGSPAFPLFLFYETTTYESAAFLV